MSEQTIGEVAGRAASLNPAASANVFLMTNTFETGGSERQFVALAGCLNPDRFAVQIGCIAKRGQFLDAVNDVAEYPLGGSLYGLQSVRTRLRLACWLRRAQIRIAHAFDFYTNLTLIPAARMARVPVLIGSQRQLGDLLTTTQAHAQKTMLGWCDAVLCNSRAAAQRLIAAGMREERIAVIRNGLPPSSFSPAVPALPKRQGLLRVGMIARMNTRSKNHCLFLRAAARVRSNCPGVEFVLVGDGPLRADLERLAGHLGIRDYVRFIGDRRDIPEIFASLDVSVLPSASESLSNAVIESMAAGVPVIATRVGGNSELIGEDRGVLFHLNDEDSLATELERLLRDPSRRAELGHFGKRFAEENFTLAEMRRGYEELYTDLLNRKSRRGRKIYVGESIGTPPRPLRVAIVGPSLRYVGGQSVQADLLLSKLRKDSELVAEMIPIDPSFPHLLRWVEKIPFVRTLVRQPLYLWALWHGLKRADVAHIFSASYWSFLLAPTPALLVAKLRGVKTLIHYHSGEARDHLIRFRSAGAVLDWADQLAVPSGYLADVFREFGLRAEIIPNTVDLSQFPFRLRQPVRPHLICTRGFHPYYCVDLVVRAFAEIKQLYQDAKLDLVGSGPLEEQIRALVQRLGVQDVHFAGVASRAQIAAYYEQADIFINASSLDNMPVSILEAFATGIPVVSTAPEGMRYLVEHRRTGLLSEPGDASELARNVIALLREPDLASLLARNARNECNRYSWSEVGPQWLSLYRSLDGANRYGIAA